MGEDKEEAVVGPVTANLTFFVYICPECQETTLRAFTLPMVMDADNS